jgi:hypothetical protein
MLSMASTDRHSKAWEWMRMNENAWDSKLNNVKLRWRSYLLYNIFVKCDQRLTLESTSKHFKALPYSALNLHFINKSEWML